jgi:nucleoid-associated protein YgaU
MSRRPARAHELAGRGLRSALAVVAAPRSGRRLTARTLALALGRPAEATPHVLARPPAEPSAAAEPADAARRVEGSRRTRRGDIGKYRP